MGASNMQPLASSCLCTLLDNRSWADSIWEGCGHRGTIVRNGSLWIPSSKQGQPALMYASKVVVVARTFHCQKCQCSSYGLTNAVNQRDCLQQRDFQARKELVDDYKIVRPGRRVFETQGTPSERRVGQLTPARRPEDTRWAWRES
jgi:hypothetical protein